MKVVVFCNGEELIVIGINEDGSLMDSNDPLFGPDSGRDIEEYDKINVDIEGGEVIHMEMENKLELSVFKP